MRMLIEELRDRDESLTRERLSSLAADLEFYPGVEGWFDRLNGCVCQRSGGTVAIRHYVISAGLKEGREGLDERIDFFAPANYAPGEELERRVRMMVDVIIARILQQKAAFEFRSDVSKAGHPTSLPST